MTSRERHGAPYHRQLVRLFNSSLWATNKESFKIRIINPLRRESIDGFPKRKPNALKKKKKNTIWHLRTNNNYYPCCHICHVCHWWTCDVFKLCEGIITHTELNIWVTRTVICVNIGMMYTNNRPCICHVSGYFLNSSPPGQNGSRFLDDISRYVFVNEKRYILKKKSLKIIPKCPIDNNPELV